MEEFYLLLSEGRIIEVLYMYFMPKGTLQCDCAIGLQAAPRRDEAQDLIKSSSIHSHNGDVQRDAMG